MRGTQNGKSLGEVLIRKDGTWSRAQTAYQATAGYIGLHDVNEDYRTSRGLETPSISGEVPRFWHELKGRHQTEELIAEPGQDGYGIGLVYV